MGSTKGDPGRHRQRDGRFGFDRRFFGGPAIVERLIFLSWPTRNGIAKK